MARRIRVRDRNDPQLRRLPAWAQDHIAFLYSKLDEVHERIAELEGNPPSKFFYKSCHRHPEQRGMPFGREVYVPSSSIYWKSPDGNDVEMRDSDGKCYLWASSYKLAILPVSGNVFEIRTDI